MKKILFDGIAMQPVGSTKIHGGGEYAKIIFKKLVDKKTNLIVFFTKKEEIPRELNALFEFPNVTKIMCDGYADVQSIINEIKVDVFYSAMPYVYNNLELPKELCFKYTIHGLRYLEMPWDKFEGKYYLSLKDKIKWLVKMTFFKFYPFYLKSRGLANVNNLLSITDNRKIFTDSFHSKYSILNFFPILKSEDVRVYYAPLTETEIGEINDKTILDKFGLSEKKYILMVSGDRWLKNNLRAAMAIDSLFSDNHKVLTDFKVVILGVKENRVYNREIKNKSKFTYFGYVQKEELCILQKNAHLFIYPTLNEGFGYPPIDTMKYGTLCACSAISSVTEACGDAVLYFNPYDIYEIRNRILESFDDSITEIKRNRMKEQYKYIYEKQKEDLELLIHDIIS